MKDPEGNVVQINGGCTRRKIEPPCKEFMTRGGTNSRDAPTTEQDFRESALQYLDGLYGYAMTLARNRAEAEELVQGDLSPRHQCL